MRVVRTRRVRAIEERFYGRTARMFYVGVERSAGRRRVAAGLQRLRGRAGSRARRTVTGSSGASSGTPASRRRKRRSSGSGWLSWWRVRRLPRSGETCTGSRSASIPPTIRSSPGAVRQDPWAIAAIQARLSPVTPEKPDARFARERSRNGARVLAARAGRRRDPAGHAARAGARTTCWCARCARASAAAPRRWSSGAACRRDQYAAMRAPFQEGDFPGPVKYGYLNVGVVEQGPPELRGRTVFCLYPHQTAYVVPAAAVRVVPEGVPPARAVLAGTVETAVNALWDAAPLVGDRVAVVGAGMVGCCVARLLGRFPASQVTLVDVDPGRAGVAAALGVDFALPADAAERPRPGRAHQRDLRRAAAVARPARARGHGHRAQLVRRRRGPAVAGRGVPLAPARHPRQPGRHGLPGPQRAPDDGRPAGAGARAAARPGLRRAAHRASRASTSCPR